jgi:hypothetical protein
LERKKEGNKSRQNYFFVFELSFFIDFLNSSLFQSTLEEHFEKSSSFSNPTKFKVQNSVSSECDMTILTPSTSPNSSSSSPSGMVSVHPSPLFVNQHLHLMHFNGLNKSNINQFAGMMEEQKSSNRSSPINATSTTTTVTASSPSVVSPPKPKIGFSIDSIVGTTSSSSTNNRPASSSSHSSASDGSRSASPPDVSLLPTNNQRLVHHESGFQSVSPRPGSSGGTPVSVRSEPESSPMVAPPPHPQMMPGWPIPPHQQQQHAAMGPAYFEALASMRALYAQQQQQPFHPHMMMAGPPPPPGAGNHPWWLLAQARQQQQRLLAVAAHQRFPAGNYPKKKTIQII